MQALEHFDFLVGLDERVAAELQLLPDDSASFVEGPDQTQQLSAVITPSHRALDGDGAAAAQVANFVELPLTRGQHVLLFCEQRGFVGEHLRQELPARVPAMSPKLEQRPQREDETAHDLPPTPAAG